MLVTDPQNDFLSEQGVMWHLVGYSVSENRTVENIKRLVQVAKRNQYEVFISLHYYYPVDYSWKFEGTLEKVMHQRNMFYRKGALSLEGFTRSGADLLEDVKGEAACTDIVSVLTSPIAPPYWHWK